MLTFDAGSPWKNTNQCLNNRSFQPQLLESREKNKPSQRVHNSKQPEKTQRRRQTFCSLQILAQLFAFFCTNAHAWDSVEICLHGLSLLLRKHSTIILLMKTMLINDYNSLKIKSAFKPLTRQHNRCD